MSARPGISSDVATYLRKFKFNICAEVLRSNTLPALWTKAATILIYEKGNLSLPENFGTNFLGTSKFENVYVIASKQDFYVFN